MSNVAHDHLPGPQASPPQGSATARQMAVVRAVADELKRCLRGGGAEDSLRSQLAEELTRLGTLVAPSGG